MWLNKLFIEEPIDFEKRCRSRVLISAVIMVIGAATWGISLYYGIHVPEEATEFAMDFYTAMGPALMAAGLVSLIRNRRYLGDEKLKRKRELAESDERNRLLGLRCWSYAGYTMFLLLYVGILISGFFSELVMRTLLAVMGLFGVVLLIFRLYLQRIM